MAISLQIKATYKSALSDASCEYRVYNTKETIAIQNRLQAISGTTHCVDSRGAYPYLNGDTEKLESPVKGSSLEVKFLIDQNASDFQKWIDFRDDLLASEEGKYIVAYLENGVFEWGGYLQHDNIREVEQSPITDLTLYAVDGLGEKSLGGFLYGTYEDIGGVDTFTRYTDADVRLTTVVQRCLQHLPHLELYDAFNGDTELFATDVNYYETTMPSNLNTDDPMYHTVCDSLRFVSIDKKSKITDAADSRSVLSEVCRFFGADIRQSGGVYQIVAFNRRTAENLRLKYYNATEEVAQLTATVPQQVLVGNDQDVVQYVDPERYLIPPVRAIKFYHKKSDYYVDSLITNINGVSNLNFGTEQSMGFVTANASNTIRIQTQFDLIVKLLQQQATNLTNFGITRLQAIIKCGTKYLTNTSISSFEYEWTNTASVCLLSTIGNYSTEWLTQPVVLPSGYVIDETFEFAFDSGFYFPPFPEDGELTIEFGFVVGRLASGGALTSFPTTFGGVTYNNDSTEGNTTGLTGLLTGGNWWGIPFQNTQVSIVTSGGEDFENADTMFIIESEQLAGEINDNSYVLELEDAYLTGGQNVDNTKVVKIWNGSAFVFSQLWQYNSGGDTFTYDKLLLYDWLRWQSESVERYQMTLKTRNNDVKFGKTLKIGNEIFVMAQGGIETGEDSVTGQWIKVIEKAPIIRNDVHEPPIKPIIKGDIIKLERLTERLGKLTRARWENEAIRQVDYIKAGAITSIPITVAWSKSTALKDNNTIRIIRTSDLTYEDFVVSADTTSATSTISVDSKTITEDIPEGSYIIFEPEYLATKINS